MEQWPNRLKVSRVVNTCGEYTGAEKHPHMFAAGEQRRSSKMCFFVAEEPPHSSCWSTRNLFVLAMF